MLETGNVTVFEVVNLSRRELFVGRTTLPMNALIAHHRAARPAAMKGWGHGDDVEYRALEFGMTPRAALEFARGYVASFRRDGWRVIGEETAA
ncbi:MAG: hypothetical protein M0D55_03800 [Elusimicrobiota bacterium]|nr:MAG: hypothetical protein M0D55_03800 [Elusimicrobiota bacterium]